MTAATPDRRRQAVLDAERAVNEQYLHEIKRQITLQPHLVSQVAVFQSQRWTTSSLPQLGIDHGANAGIIGRVALEDGHPYSDMMDHTFYIAGWHLGKDKFGHETVNWTAPVARVFFEGRSSEHELAASVVGRRTFVLRLADLVDYADEIEHGVADPFGGRTTSLEVPVAPTGRRPTVRQRAEVRPAPEPAAAEFGESADTCAPATLHRQTATKPETRDLAARAAEAALAEPSAEATRQPVEAAGGSDVTARRKNLRAAEAVVKVMQMPKQGRMGAVLPTMQPDQYRLVAASANRDLVVQGQPGTGKTVIAAHRAVYLTSEARGSDRVARAAIIGPSDEYVAHVAPVISELKEPEAEIQVIGLPTLLRNIAGLRSSPKPGPIGRIESSWDVGRMIGRFVKSMGDPPSPSAPGGIDQRVRRVKRRGNNLVREDPRSGRKERSNRDQPIRRVVEAMKRADKSEILDEEI